MNGQAKLILWVGLFLIVMIVVAHWAEIKFTIFANRPASQKGPAGGSSGGGNCPPGTINIPGIGCTGLGGIPGFPVPTAARPRHNPIQAV